MKSDTNIRQDLRLMQVIVREAVQANPAGGVTIVNVGQITVTSSGVDFLDKPEAEKVEAAPLIEDKRNISIKIDIVGSPEFFERLREIALAKGSSIAEQAQRFIIEGMERNKTCTEEGCNQDAIVRGRCRPHYAIERRRLKKKKAWNPRKLVRKPK